MNQFCKLLSPGAALINRSIYNFSRKPLGFYMIPYDEQYESRDNESEIKRRKQRQVSSYGKFIHDNNDKNLTRKERQEKIKEFLDKTYSNQYTETHRNSLIYDNLK